jgi:hypothetical protein
VVIVFGAATKKIIDIRTVNRECSVCKKNSEKIKSGIDEAEIETHFCYVDPEFQGKMEQKLTEAAFKDAFKRKIKYTKLISDADTSTYPAIQQIFLFGIEKADCVEHTIRAFKRHLHAFCGNTDCGKAKDRALIKASISNILLTARIAMKRSASKLKTIEATDEYERQEAKRCIIDELWTDLHACALHALNIHDACRREKCRFITATDEWDFSELDGVDAVQQWLKTRPKYKMFTSKVLKMVKLAIANDISIEHSNALQHALNNHSDCPPALCDLIRLEKKLDDATKKHLQKNMMRLANKAERVAEYLNSNLAESYMAIMNMLLGGRRINNQLRGAFFRQTRLAALIMSDGYFRYYFYFIKLVLF